MLNLVKELCALPGVSSFEDEVRDYIRQRVTPFADSVRTDALGNLIVFKRGAGWLSAPTWTRWVSSSVRSRTKGI